MSLSRSNERRNAIVTSPEPLLHKLTRIDQLVRATAVLALLSDDGKIRHVFDELLDLYIAMSADVVAPDGGTSSAYVNREAVARDRSRRTTRSHRMVPAHLLSV